MTLDFSVAGKFMINMQSYIKEVMKHLPEEFIGKATTPAADHLFKTRDNTLKLNEQEAELCHHTIAQLLFIWKQGCPNIHTAVTFLCTRFKTTDQHDYKMLIRVIWYLRCTKNS